MNKLLFFPTMVDSTLKSGAKINTSFLKFHLLGILSEQWGK